VKHNKDSKFRKDYLVDEFGVNRDRVRKTVGDSRPSVWEGISFKAGYEADWKTLTEEQSSFDLSGAQQNKDDSRRSDSVDGEADEETIDCRRSEVVWVEENNGEVSYQRFVEKFSQQRLEKLVQKDELMQPTSDTVTLGRKS